MNVGPGHRHPRHGPRLGGAHLVVREDQVGSAALQVETGTEMMQGDGGALNVPAGSANAERRGPARLPGAGEPPQQAVQRVAFPRPFGIPAAFGEDLEHAFLVVVADLPEIGRVRGVEVPVGVLGILHLIDQPGGQQFLDQLHHARNGFDCPDVAVGWDDAQRSHVGAEQFGLVLGQFLPVLPRCCGTFQQRIVHIRDVLDVVDLQAEVPPDPVDQVEGEVGVGVPQVRGVIGGDAAHVHPGVALRGADGNGASGGGVVQPEPLGHVLRRRDAGNLDWGPRIHGHKTTASEPPSRHQHRNQ